MVCMHLSRSRDRETSRVAAGLRTQKCGPHQIDCTACVSANDGAIEITLIRAFQHCVRKGKIPAYANFKENPQLSSPAQDGLNLLKLL